MKIPVNKKITSLTAATLSIAQFIDNKAYSNQNNRNCKYPLTFKFEIIKRLFINKFIANILTAIIKRPLKGNMLIGPKGMFRNAGPINPAMITM